MNINEGIKSLLKCAFRLPSLLGLHVTQMVIIFEKPPANAQYYCTSPNIYTLFLARTLFLFRGQKLYMLNYWLPPPVKRRIVITVCQRCLFTDDLA